jgi:hypothetical protein
MPGLSPGISPTEDTLCVTDIMIMEDMVGGVRIIEEDITITDGMTTTAMIQEDIMMNTGIGIGIINFGNGLYGPFPSNRRLKWIR